MARHRRVTLTLKSLFP